MEINLVCVGNIKEKYLKMAIDEYKKRIQAFAKLNIMEIKERNSDDSIKNLKEEGIDILNVVNDAYMITLEINGESVDSISFSEQIKKYFLYNNKKLYFVIGSSEGLSDEVKRRSNKALSFSQMTFPHQLMRVIFLEQIYRAFSIINNKKYHK